MNRTKKTVYNVFVSSFNSVFSILIQFLVRTFFVNILGSYYLGLNGLFTNVLNILSIGELGLGTAIMYSLYEPIEKKDYDKINTLNSFYKKFLTLVCIVIFAVGLLLSIRLDLIINVTVTNEIRISYYIFLLDTCLSYLFLDKENIIVAHQKKYVINSINIFYNLIMTIFQIIFLVTTKSYYFYLIIKLLCDFFRGFYISKKAFKMYPFLKNKEKSLNTNDKRKLLINVKALSIYKLCSAVLTGTDNIVISKFVNLDSVGLVSNYTLIISGIDLVIREMFNSVTAILGNYSVTENNDKQLELFNLVQFLSFVIYGIASVCLMILIQPFIHIWVGEKSLINISIVAVMIINFYLIGMNRVMGMYREVFGLFQYGKYRPLLMAILNVIFSLILVKYVGLIGVYLGTVLSRILTQTWYDPYIIFKLGFNRKIFSEYKLLIMYLIKLMITFFIVYSISSYIVVSSLILFMVKAVVVFCLTVVIFLIFNFRSGYYQMFFKILRTMKK